MKILSLSLTLLFLLACECALLRPLGFSVARVDVHVAAVVFLALRTPTLEGAIGSFIFGYFIDTLSGQPSNLYVFTSVLTFLVGRLLAPFVEVRSATGFAVLVAGIDVLHNLATWGLSLVGTADGISRGAMLSGLLPTATLSALAALGIWPLFKAIEARFKKPESGLLL